jgi:hypothetical protein
MLALAIAVPAILFATTFFVSPNDPHWGPPMPTIAYLYFFLLFAATPLAFLAWCFHSYVRLDELGLTWRIGLRTTTCRWDDVMDY